MNLTGVNCHGNDACVFTLIDVNDRKLVVFLFFSENVKRHGLAVTPPNFANSKTCIVGKTRMCRR